MDSTTSPEKKPFLLERIIETSSRNAFLIIILVVFGIAGGVWALTKTPLDAIPDLSDVQVIVYTDWEGRSPDLVEDQITYPISTRFIAAPKVKFVRGESMFGKSFIYVIFQDGTDIYWARSRVIEYLSAVRGMLPEGVNPVIGPDATGVGWVYEYALVDKTGKHNLAELRSFQDWHLRYALESVKGVSEVAPVGGFVKQYQVDLDPNKLLAYGIPISEVVNKIRMSNGDVGGKIFEVGSTEFYVRGRGYIKKIEDIENVPLKSQKGTPVYVRNVGTVHLGPDIRRGISELNGEGEVVGGIVVMRYGENALRVIDGIKKKLEEIKSSLPEGVEVVTTYDRSQLIKDSVDLNSVGEIHLHNAGSSLDLKDGVLTLWSANEIKLECGPSSISIKSDGTIEVNGPQKVKATGGGSGVELTQPGATMTGTKATVSGSTMTEITGGLVKIN